MRLDDLNRLDDRAAAREMLQCCGSTRWAARMSAARPFGDLAALEGVADREFAALARADWLEAFAAHPAIGGAGKAGGAGGAGGEAGRAGGQAGKAGEAGGATEDVTVGWAANEQRLVAHASDATRQRLADLNRAYEARFGYIFIVCATGKTAAEMLALLERRLGNDPHTELQIAANEQKKITHLRLHKLVDSRQDG